jgi:hypothetical protein
VFVVALKKSECPVVWQTPHGLAIVALTDESLAYYFTSHFKSRVLRGALVLTASDAVQQLPLLPTIHRMLVLRSAEAIDALLGRDPSAEELVEIRKSPWWVSPSKSGRKHPRFVIPLT